MKARQKRRSARQSSVDIDPITLEVFNHRLSAIAEEMGVALCRSAFSPNIKERRDFSCALFDAYGGLVAQAAHIPVHLGSTQLSVEAAIAERPMAPGDVVMLNDPYAGGTHLPDVTLVAPVYLSRERRPFGYVANRAHHADIGGGTPGSMPLATEILQEGLRIPPVRLVAAGRMNEDVLDLFLANTRVTDERRGDLLAQLAALRLGARRLVELSGLAGRRRVAAAMLALPAYTARLMTAALRRIRPGLYQAQDWMDDDGAGALSVPIRVAVRLANGRAVVDFHGTAPQVAGGINANFAVTTAAVLYVFQCLAGQSIPANAGLMKPIRILAPEGSLVNACFPSAVAGGNVETSQRIVDVLFKALARAAPEMVPAASCGSMNNFSIGGRDINRHRDFAYYETIAGGAGAGPTRAALSAVHTHMTNTLNTPIEALEASYPMRIVSYSIRRGSGGSGQHRGGDGVRREIELLAPAQATVLTERRRLAPFGVNGGQPGKRGLNQFFSGGKWRRVAGKVTLRVQIGDRIAVETPGGGGWGRRATPRRWDAET
ncbi:MAG: hydantoinase B/oxoprolinase family protein [Deltaproteobacteria bacterium]|nr:hydantoinase B/oxoprolinase family protein [Deltaproteobacteria bacterium]